MTNDVRSKKIQGSSQQKIEIHRESNNESIVSNRTFRVDNKES